MIRIHVTNTSFHVFPSALIANGIMPELSCDGVPLTPKEIISVSVGILLHDKEIVTCSEVFILFVLYCIRKHTRGEITPLGLEPKDVAIFYHAAQRSPMRLRIDGDGEFIDRWPNGFFDERVPLLFD